MIKVAKYELRKIAKNKGIIDYWNKPRKGLKNIMSTLKRKKRT